MSKQDSSHSPSSVLISDILLNRFYDLGIRTIFAIPGGHVDHLLKKIAKDGRFRLILSAHEEGAAYMADGYARISNHPSLVITINGPGLTNLITPAVTTRVDHSPVIFLSGDAPSVLDGFDAFQSSEPKASNTSALMEQALGHSFDLSDPSELFKALAQFENLLNSPYPAPMHLNFPLDIADFRVDEMITENNVCEIHNDFSLNNLPDVLPAKSLILVGEGITRQADYQCIADFSLTFEIPVAVTMSAKNMQPLIDESRFLGVFGYGGGERAFKAVLDPTVDLLILFGVHLNERNTVLWHPDFFNPNRTILAINPLNIPKYLATSKFHELSGNVSDIVKALQQHWMVSHNGESSGIRKHWSEDLSRILRIPTLDQSSDRKSIDGRLSMEALVSILNRELPENSRLFLDSGDHRIYGSTYWEVKTPNSFFTAAQTAPMGWAIAAGIGASFEVEDAPICVITGDGCMLMHGMEIAIAAKHHRKVLFIVCNNGTYGRVAIRLKTESEEVRDAITSLPEVSWSGFASSLGVPACKVTNTAQLVNAIGSALKEEGPFLMDVMTTIDELVPFPKAVFSSSMPGFMDYWNKRISQSELEE